jgi:hypothetical protein
LEELRVNPLKLSDALYSTISSSANIRGVAIEFFLIQVLFSIGTQMKIKSHRLEEPTGKS